VKGDFSRNTFKKEKHYSKVNIQQGRVSVDADSNEQNDINQHFQRTSLFDIIGQTGAPEDNPGFEIRPYINSVGEPTYIIGQGRFYVDGILIENEYNIAEPIQQPDLPLNSDGSSLSIILKDGFYIVYLDVWERHITELDDEEIKESALDGPDTATRNKIIWQVKLLPINPSGERIGGELNLGGEGQTLTCKTDIQEWNDFILPSNGTLMARTKPEITLDDPCKIPPGSGYRRLENQLYRIEVHKAGTANSGATFKWQRDNGTVVVKATDINEQKITVTNKGKDDNLLGFSGQQWVEVIDDRHELLNIRGTLAKVISSSSDENELNIVKGTVIGEPLNNTSYPKEFNPKVRRWDSTGGEIPITIPSSNEGYIEIEDGVEVRFNSADGDTASRPIEYRTGDYWLVPARYLKGDVEWPRDKISGSPLGRLPDGITHHFARLAILEYTNESFTLIDDCRLKFPPLTRIKATERPTPPSTTILTKIHGNAVWVQDPDSIKSERNSYGSHFFSPSRVSTQEYKNYFHFPLSTSLSYNPSIPILDAIQIVFKTEFESKLTGVSLFDGNREIPEQLSGDDIERFLDTSMSDIYVINWRIGKDLKIDFGLGITIEVSFPNDGGQLYFYSVGAEFIYK